MIKICDRIDSLIVEILVCFFLFVADLILIFLGIIVIIAVTICCLWLWLRFMCRVVFSVNGILDHRFAVRIRDWSRLQRGGMLLCRRRCGRLCRGLVLGSPFVAILKVVLCSTVGIGIHGGSGLIVVYCFGAINKRFDVLCRIMGYII